MHEIKISAEEAHQRIDVFLSRNIEGLTRNACQHHIKTGAVTVNSSPTTKNYRLCTGDIINITIKPAIPYTASSENITLNIVYEDNDIIIVNKPRGMVVHPAAGHGSGTLVNALMHHCGDFLSGINGIMRPGIVHRLDKDTSGLLVVAKNDLAHQALTTQWSANMVERTYQALCFSTIKPDTLTINKPIGRHPANRKKMTIAKPVDTIKSRHAITHVWVLERFKCFTLVEARLETGRTHQIRVHLSSIGHPVLGDTVYGKEKQPFGLNGQVLHAKSLSFLHPTTREHVQYSTELPDYFTKVLNSIRSV